MPVEYFKGTKVRDGLPGLAKVNGPDQSQC